MRKRHSALLLTSILCAGLVSCANPSPNPPSLWLGFSMQESNLVLVPPWQAHVF